MRRRSQRYSKRRLELTVLLPMSNLSVVSGKLGEPVDDFVAAPRRLAKMANVESDELLRRVFVVGLPMEVSRELRAMANVNTTPLPQIVDRARALMAETTRSELAAVTIMAKPCYFIGVKEGVAMSRRCFKCNGPHLTRNCTALEGTNRCLFMGH